MMRENNPRSQKLNIQPSGHNQFPEIANRATQQIRTDIRVKNTLILDLCRVSMDGAPDCVLIIVELLRRTLKYRHESR
jgi:hypothetical protein